MRKVTLRYYPIVCSGSVSRWHAHLAREFTGGTPVLLLQLARYPIVLNANSSYFLTGRQSPANAAATDTQDAAS